MSREALYVGLTRGRDANHAYVVTESGHSEIHLADDPPTGRQILEAVLRSPSSEASATNMLRRLQAEHLLSLSRAGHWPPAPDAEATRPTSAAGPHRPPRPPGLTR